MLCRGASGVNWCCVIQVWIVTVVKLAGTDVFVNWSTAMGVIAIIPSIIFMTYGCKEVDPHTWVSTRVLQRHFTDDAHCTMSLLVEYITHSIIAVAS